MFLIKNKVLLNRWNHVIIPIIAVIALKDPKIGQGL